jgi:ABC-type antimicrobial peptide transport system permease subunit
VATGTVGALYGWLAALLDASSVLGQRVEGDGLPVTDVGVSVGGAGLIAAVATAGVLFATSVDKVRETVLLRVAGASRRTLSLKGAMEAFIYAATAAIMSALLMAANSAAFAWVLNIGPVPGASFAGIPWQPFLICVGGFVLILLVAVPTVNRAAKRDPVEILGTN